MKEVYRGNQRRLGGSARRSRIRTGPIILLALFLLTVGMAGMAGCTLRIGVRSKIPGFPALTAIPHVETAEPMILPGATPPAELIALPPGFTISIFARDLNGPRMLAVGPDGHLYVAERGAGRILRLPDEDGNGSVDSLDIAAEALQDPSSLAFYRDGSLYVSETTRILRLSEPDAQGLFQKRQVVIDGLPAGGHNTRTILFSPDGSKLYVSIGSSCNVCLEEDPRRAAILQFNPDGSGGQIFAHGLRNAVGLTFRPGTDQLWTTNIGRDMMGDDLPPDTIQSVHQGQDFGWPRCHAGRISDPELGGSGGCKHVSPANIELQAHSAPLGLTFYAGSQFPASYQGNLFVAQHGSWNRSTPTGYKIVRIPFANNQPGPVYDFATGWLRGGSAWGRPVDIITANDGSLMLSDDASGIIYRISTIGQER